MNIQTLLAFLSYFLVLLVIGFLAYRKQTSSADFIVGNRSLNFWVIALSAHASDMSSWLFMGYPAAVMIRGLPQVWIVVGLICGMLLNWQFVAKRLRSLTEDYGCYTLSTFFEKRFHDTSGLVRIITAVMSLVFLTCYLCAGLMGMGLLFESIFHIDYYFGLSLATFVVIAYTFTGGFVTVAWTDLFQALFLLMAIALVPVMALGYIPGEFAAIQSSAAAQGISLRILPDHSLKSLLTALFLVFGWGLGYFGQPHIITKFLGIKSAKDLSKSKYVGMTWMVLACGAATLVGLVGIPLFEGALTVPELVFVEMVKTSFNPFISGFILCGVIAATLSTMDSQILVCASVISQDIYKRAIHQKASQKTLLAVTRGGVILISLISLSIAFIKTTTILAMVQYAWSGLGCAFGPLVLMSLYTKHTNKFGAVAGILVGGALAGFWDTINPLVTVYEVPAMIPGFLCSLLSVAVVSKLTTRKTI